MLKDFVKRVGKFTGDNSPAILTAIGVVGTLTTAYLTGKASFKAADMIARDEMRSGVADDPRQRVKEQVRLVWTLYVPPAGTALMTVICIILANRIGTRRAAALAAAYAISEKAFVEYKDKVIEKIGKGKEQALRDELAQDRVNSTPLSEAVIIGSGSVLCFETFTGRYFLSDMETLKKTQNDLNYRILHDYYVSLTDFYNLVGLPSTAVSDEFGWNTDKMMELQFSTVLSEDQRPCLSIDFAVTPIRDFYKVH